MSHWRGELDYTYIQQSLDEEKNEISLPTRLQEEAKLPIRANENETSHFHFDFMVIN